MQYVEFKAAIHRHQAGDHRSSRRCASTLLPLLGLLLFTTSCAHKKAVVFEHDASFGQDTIIYRGKPMSPEELFELGENAKEDQIDLIVKQDGTAQKLDLKRWHTGMRLLPELMQSRAEEPE